MPKHVAIIMDGNGRWAAKRGLSRSDGHKQGTEAAKAIVTHCRELGIGHLTLYTFSKENWGRPKDEVRFLFDLLRMFLNSELKSLLEQSIRLKVLGDISSLPAPARMTLEHVQKKTENGDAMVLNLALNYSGRDEILRAARRLIEQGVRPEDVTEETFSSQLYTCGQPDPDLVIRTSGEQRLSNYLLFQAAYSELYFTTVYWPDFTPEEFDKALADFTGRQRRFGLTGSQASG
ncbi:polyprenyl diphosphate synthase [Desulfovibrio inopinatus]|uniref:polyprenyl diphosphate synthase n=1 Tax=Desulfovibrio inopinatus TaxID=102109 RepID=UPI0006860C29|nr:polyprenyl diphosphate synthase [Desulfovibrio inopinatus]